MPRLLDLFCGRWGWSRAFAARGWECFGIDLTAPSETPVGCEFLQRDIRGITTDWITRVARPDFIVASSPCTEFSLFGMRNFHPNPPYPESGIELFNHSRKLCWNSGVRWVMENVRSAQDFVGRADHHCGPFFLWGDGVPPLMPQGITKGMKLGGAVKFGAMSIEERRKHRTQDLMLSAASGSPERLEWTAKVATIPPELANCVADYAEALLREKVPA